MYASIFFIFDMSFIPVGKGWVHRWFGEGNRTILSVSGRAGGRGYDKWRIFREREPFSYGAGMFRWYDNRLIDMEKALRL